jgi:hypothetical protein
MTSEWYILSEQMPVISWQEQLHWEYDDVLDQHAQLDFFYNASSLAHSPRTISWFSDNQSTLLLLKAVCLAEKQKQQIPIYRLWLDPTGARIHRTSSKHTNHYTTNAVL